jgi:hypothetical protein
LAQHGDSVSGQGCHSVFSAFAVAGDVRPGPELDVVAGELDQFAYSQPGLDGEHQLNAKLSFRTTLSCDATGTGLHLHKHTRPERNPLRRKGGSV